MPSADSMSDPVPDSMPGSMPGSAATAVQPSTVGGAAVASAAMAAALKARRRATDTRHAPLSLLDEAAHALRSAPAATLGAYYAGTLPFILVFLFFWADMSRSADAEERSTGATLGLAALFVAMKVGQAVFAVRLRAQFARRAPERFRWRRLARLAFIQAVIQPSALFVLPVAALVTIPLAWVYAFYQNVSAHADGRSVRDVVRHSIRDAKLWPKGNHTALLVLGLLGLFGWINLLVAVYILPQLLRMFTGEENIFTRSGSHLFNSTFFAVTVALVFLALDPLIKTFYALRCFYGASSVTGEDLISDLRTLPPRQDFTGVAAIGKTPNASNAPDALAGAGAMLPNGLGSTFATPGARPSKRSLGLVAALLTLAIPSPHLRADPDATPASGTAGAPVRSSSPAVVSPAASARGGAVSTSELDRSIHDVLGKREFAWRGPRAKPSANDEADGPIARFLSSVGAWIKKQFTAASDTVRDGYRWLRRLFHSDDGQESRASETAGSGVSVRPLMYSLVALLALAAIALIVFFLRDWLRSRKRVLTGRAAPEIGAITAPDLAAEEILANQLPEDEWLQLANGLLARGERRLALRALYLSLLAALGAHGMLGIARHKSNRDYLGEVRRRARDREALQDAFARNVGRFERVWYGPHAADDFLVADFQTDRLFVLANLPV